MAHESTHEPAAEWVAIDAVHPWERNPRRNDKAIDRVADSIRRLGWGAPIVARRADGEIIAGHTRYAAAVKLGMPRVPVRFVDLDPGDAHLLALADNKLGEIAEWDDDELRGILAEMDKDDRALAGFLDADVRAVLDGQDDASPQLGDMVFRVVVDCRDEEHQAEIIAQLESEGMTCRPLIS